MTQFVGCARLPDPAVQDTVVLSAAGDSLCRADTRARAPADIEVDIAADLRGVSLSRDSDQACGEYDDADS